MTGIFDNNFWTVLDYFHDIFGTPKDKIINQFNLGFYDDFLNEKRDDIVYSVPKENDRIRTTVYIKNSVYNKIDNSVKNDIEISQVECNKIIKNIFAEYHPTMNYVDVSHLGLSKSFKVELNDWRKL